jgi:hypothetical protein
MAHIAITFADQPDGKVDIKVYLDQVVEGAPDTPAQKLVKTMLHAAQKEAPEVSDAAITTH